MIYNKHVKIHIAWHFSPSAPYVYQHGPFNIGGYRKGSHTDVEGTSYICERDRL
jgi:hypothetical protein